MTEFGREILRESSSGSGAPHWGGSNRQNTTHHYHHADYPTADHMRAGVATLTRYGGDSSAAILPHDRGPRISRSPDSSAMMVAQVNSGRNIRHHHHPRADTSEIIVPRKSSFSTAAANTSSRIPRRAPPPPPPSAMLRGINARSSRSFSPPHYRPGNYNRNDLYHYQQQRTDHDRDADERYETNHPHNKYSIERYVQEPMLCQYLWKQQQHTKERNPSTTPATDIATEYESNNSVQKEYNIDANNNEKSISTVGVQQEGEHTVPLDSSEPPIVEPLSSSPEKQATMEQQKEDDNSNILYQAYNQDYCTNVIRCFFNAHLDDEWFQKRYSPHHRVMHSMKERERASHEAKIIMDAVLSNKQKFVTQSRLGKGKPNSACYTTKKRKHDSSSDTYYSELRGVSSSKEQQHPNSQEPQDPDEGHILIDDNTIPASHLLSSQDPSLTLKVTHIPPHVTDSQILNAFEDLCRYRHSASTKGGGEQQKPSTAVDRVCSTTVGGSASSDYYCEFLDRTAFVVFANEEAKEHVAVYFCKKNVESKRGTIPTRHIAAVDGRHRDDEIFDMDLDCSDPFNRLEIDADGKGGAPATATATAELRSRSSSSEEVATPKVPIRKATIRVHTGSRLPRDSNIHDPRQQGQQRVIVLSAAVSSTKFITSNKTESLMIARALDRSKGVPSGFKLDDLVTIIFGEESESDPDLSEDILDVSIAYLRRVHLFSFYTGQTATCEGDVLAGTAGTIHLRLEDVKEKAGTKVSSSDSNHVESDVLVQRLNDVITKAMDESTARLASMGVVVSPEVDSAAEEARNDEMLAKNQWLEDHSFLDADGRARCSFHFCKKLFKDKIFLQKHLLKKHPEYLAGEQAKVHDKYMMQAWEQEEVRPAPRVTINCGTRFGFIKVAMRGARPIAEDPEPVLHEKVMEEERRKDAEARAREKELQRERQRWQAGSSLQDKLGFIDVDDMEEEEIKIAFDQVEFPPPTKKKKKKKMLA